MNIGLFTERTAGLGPDLLAVIEDRVHDSRGNGSEREAVGDGESRREEQGRICLVFLDIESSIGREDTADFVRLAGVVEGGTGRDGHELGVPGVGVVKDGDEDPY